MATGWNSESDREAMLRRVAIVLSSLPAPVAAQLLGSMGDDSKRAVRQTMSTLSDVDPLERRRALQAFKVSCEQSPQVATPRASNTGSAGDVAPAGRPSQVMTANGVAVSALSPQGSPADPASSALAFMRELDADTLIRLLRMEHPQATALVLASIDPVVAAQVLPRLDERTQSDALSRIGRLGEIPEAAVAEVAEHFRSRVEEDAKEKHSATGQRALDAILAAMPTAAPAAAEPTASSPVHSHAADVDQVTPRSVTNASDTVSPVNFPSSDVAALDLTHRLREAEQTWPNEAEQPASEESGAASVHLRVQVPDPQETSPGDVVEPDNSEPSTDEIHQHLIQLEPAELCRALGNVDTRDAILALCGLPNQVTEAALANLPKGAAKKVRSNMHALGSMSLRDIDLAKEKVANVSINLGQRSTQVPLAA